jgi:GAF domain-containing protein
MAVDEAAFTASLITLLARVDLPPSTDQQQLLGRLDEVLRATTLVLGVDSVGLMLLDDSDALRVVGTTDDAAAALEVAQLELRIGPAIDCLRTGRCVSVDDLATGADYPAVWNWLTSHPRPPASDVRSVLSVPVPVRGETVGTLNALHHAPQSWDTAQVRAVEAYAGLIGILLRLGAAIPTDRGSTLPTGPPEEV